MGKKHRTRAPCRGEHLSKKRPFPAVSGSKRVSPTLAVSGTKYLSLAVSGWVSFQTVVINIAGILGESGNINIIRPIFGFLIKMESGNSR